MKKKTRLLPIIVSALFISLLIGCDALSGLFGGDEEKNRPPTAEAGLDQSVFTENLVQLDGSGSSDPDGDNLSYSWSFASMPTGSSTILSDPVYWRPTFQPDLAGAYVLQLIVSDGKSNSAPDTVTITVTIAGTGNTPPVADAGSNQSVLINQTVQLDGSGSSDDDLDELLYAWTFTSRPAGSTSAFSDPSAVNPTFVPDIAGDYVIQLVVNDGTVDSSPSSVTVSVSDDPSLLPLELVDARSTGGYTVEVEFNKQVDETSATDIGNYDITFRTHELYISTATIDETGKTVTLTTLNSQTARDDSMPTLTVSNVEDTYGNIIADSNNEKNFQGTIPVGSADFGSSDEYSVSGYIEDDSGERLSNFYISISNPGIDNVWGDNWGTNDDIYLELFTDQDGLYSINGLPAGSGDELTDPYFSMFFNFNDDFGHQIYEGKDFEGFNTENITQSHTKNLVFYEVVADTKVEGYVKGFDNNPILDFGASLYLYRGEMQIMATPSAKNGYGDPDEKIYYNPDTGYFHFQDCLAGGSYTLHMYDYEDNMYSEFISNVFTATPGTVTTLPDITTYKITQNNNLPIYMLTPEDTAAPDSPITFSWEHTVHSNIQSYALGIWSGEFVDTSGDYPMPQGQPDMLYYIVPESVNEVTIDTSTSPMTISGDLYRQITNVQLSGSETYYWGVFAFNTAYNEADENGSFSGEPEEGLRSFSQTAPPVLSSISLSVPSQVDKSENFNLTLTAIDQYGATLTTFEETVTLSSTNAGIDISPTITGSFTEGVLTLEVSLNDVGTTQIEVVSGEVTAQSENITVEYDISLVSTQIDDLYGTADTRLAIHPTTHDLYAYTANFTYRSSDNGVSWTPDDSFNTSWYRAIHIATDDPTIVYGGSESFGISSDGGNTFQAGQDLPPESAGYINCIQADPQNAQIVYVSTNGNLLKSDSYGISEWTDIVSTSNGLPTATKYLKLFIDPDTPTTIFVQTESGGLYRTTDNGANWTYCGPNYSTGNLKDVDWTDDGSTIVLIEDDSLYRSEDGGDTWNHVYSNPANVQINKIGIKADNPDYVYAIGNNTITPNEFYLYRSTTGGSAFDNVYTFEENVSQFELNSFGYNFETDPDDSNIIYLAPFYGSQYMSFMFRSIDSGATWDYIRDGIYNFQPYEMYIDSSDRLYLFEENFWYFIMRDILAEESYYYRSLYNWSTGRAAEDPNDPDTIWYTYGYGISKITNNGSNMTQVHAGHASSGMSVFYDGVSTNILYSQITEESTQKPLYLSTNGFLFNEANSPVNTYIISDIVVDPSDTDNVIVSSLGNGYFISNDGLTSWVSYANPGTIYDIEIDQSDSSVLYFAAQDDIYKSIDGGVTAAQLDISPPVGQYQCIQIDPVDSNIVYASAGSMLIYSVDGGGSWQEFVFETDTSRYLGSIILRFAPNDTDTLYVGTWNGVYKVSISR